MSRPYRILICGSRRWDDKTVIALAMAAWIEEQGSSIGAVYPPPVVVHGGAAGADRLAGSVARNWGWREEVHPAASVDGVDVVLSFPMGWSPDTRRRMRDAEAAGVPVVDCAAAVSHARRE